MGSARGSRADFGGPPKSSFHPSSHLLGSCHLHSHARRGHEPCEIPLSPSLSPSPSGGEGGLRFMERFLGRRLTCEKWWKPLSGEPPDRTRQRRVLPIFRVHDLTPLSRRRLVAVAGERASGCFPGPLNAAPLWRQVAQAVKAVTSLRTPKTGDAARQAPAASCLETALHSCRFVSIRGCC
jgi:hypothetical protein